MNLWFSILLITICSIFWDIGVVFQKKQQMNYQNW